MASDDEDDLFKVETVPPPEGESDVYNAPTRVGVLAGSIVEEIVQQARRQAEQQGRSGSSGSPGNVDEPAVIDPMKLRALEELAARQEAALRPPPVPSDLGAKLVPPPSVKPAAVETQPHSAPPPPAPLPLPVSIPLPRDVGGTPPVRFHAEPSPQPPLNGVPSVAPMMPSPQPPPAVQPKRTAPAARSSSRLSTVLILVLVLLCLAFGVYRLIGAKVAARGSASPRD